MSSQLLQEILAKAEQLSPEEQRQVIDSLARKVENEKTLTDRPQRKWMDIAGRLPYPAYGEDAQTYISKLRQEADRERNNQIRCDHS